MVDPTAFYSAIASLIPVLVLTAVLEIQAFGRRYALGDMPTPLLLLAFVAVIAFFANCIAAEVIALHALLYGPPGEEGRDVAQLALVIGTAILLPGPLIPFFIAIEEQVGRWFTIAGAATWLLVVW